MLENTNSSEINYPYVIFLSIVAALGGFLFGYDTAVISGTITMVSEQYNLDALMQGWYVSSALVGSIVGVLIAGWLSDKLGRKKAMAISASLFFISALGCAVAQTIDLLVLYRIIGGLGIGMISIISPMYISEIAITRIRGSLVSLYQLAITIGFLGAFLMNYKLLEYSHAAIFEGGIFEKIFVTEVWRAMLGMEALPAGIFFIIILLIPESPRWLVIKNKYEKASKILLRIYGSPEYVKKQFAEMEKAPTGSIQKGWAMLRDSVFFKVVLIGAAIAILGQFMGVNAVLYYGPTIFEQNGLSGDDALFYQVLVGVVNAVTTILALFIIDRVGRKKLIYFGVSGMIITLILIAGFFHFGEQLQISNIWLLISFLSYIFFTAGSISAVIFVLLSEMFPTKIRGRAMSIAGFSLWVGTFLIGQLTPWFLETFTPQGTFLFFAIMCFPYIYIIWKYVPETAGKSLEDIEKYWVEKKW